MDITGVLRPEELPFPVTDMLREDIENLLRAMEEDSDMLDCYQDEVYGSGRDLREDEERFIQRYYVRGGWRNGVPYHGVVYGAPRGGD